MSIPTTTNNETIIDSDSVSDIILSTTVRLGAGDPADPTNVSYGHSSSDCSSSSRRTSISSDSSGDPDPDPEERKSFECYQISIRVKISEEDSCLFRRFGLSIFNIFKEDRFRRHFIDNPRSDPKLRRLLEIPDAVILSVTIDKCDCTKAIFNVYVRLPCKQLVCSDPPIATTTSTTTTSTTTTTTTAAPSTTLGDPTWGCGCGCVGGCGCNNAIASSKNLVVAGGANGNCGCGNNPYTLTSRDTVFQQAAGLGPSIAAITQCICEGGKFVITSGASGHEREIVTFYVNPLPPNVVGSGVFNECYEYDITRVPCRTIKGCRTQADLMESGFIDVATDNINCCGSLNPIGGNSLTITFPMTKEIKCIVPDFRLGGTVLNTLISSQLATKVRVVSRSCPVFSIPALLTFDKEKCSVCLIISLEYIALNKQDLVGFEQFFGAYGCAKRCCNATNIANRLSASDARSTLFGQNCCDEDKSNDSILCEIVKRYCDCCLGPASSAFMQFLASAKKLDVMGLDKCTEKVLFTFQVCYVPWGNFCLTSCGCKFQTEPIVNQKCCNQMLSTSASAFLDFTTCRCCFKNSYTIMAEGDYSYEYKTASSLAVANCSNASAASPFAPRFA
jgi:hypothetical protein